MKSNNQLHYKLLWHFIGWAMVVFVVYYSIIPNPPEVMDFHDADKLEHLLAYGGLMGWFGQLSFTTRKQINWIIGLCLMGVLMEIIQGWSGYRDFEYADMVADAAGVLFGWGVSRYWCRGWLYRFDQFISRK